MGDRAIAGRGGQLQVHRRPHKVLLSGRRGATEGRTGVVDRVVRRVGDGVATEGNIGRIAVGVRNATAVELQRIGGDADAVAIVIRRLYDISELQEVVSGIAEVRPARLTADPEREIGRARCRVHRESATPSEEHPHGNGIASGVAVAVLWRRQDPHTAYHRGLRLGRDSAPQRGNGAENREEKNAIGRGCNVKGTCVHFRYLSLEPFVPAQIRGGGGTVYQRREYGNCEGRGARLKPHPVALFMEALVAI